MAYNKKLMALGFELHTDSTTEVSWLTPPICVIPSGSFVMGSDSTRDPQAFPNELPQHVVSLPAFEMAMFPVTVAEFALALSAGAVGLEEPDNWASQSASLLNPVYGLTWYDAIAYACWLAALTNEYWRLPTEAEWEKAARGTDGRIYPWGDNWDSERVNIWQERVTPATQAPQAYGKRRPLMHSH